MRSKYFAMDCTLRKMLLSLLLFPSLAEGSFSRSYGILTRDILLPCAFHASSNFNLKNLIITWQRTDSLTVVYSFYSGTIHPEHQDKAFLDRTQLFLSEFTKGNASLKLERMLLSDVGNYTCFVTVDDGMPHIENVVELKLNDISENNTSGGTDPASERKKLVLILPLLLVILIAVGILHWQMKNKEKPDIEEMIHLLEDNIKGSPSSLTAHSAA